MTKILSILSFGLGMLLASACTTTRVTTSPKAQKDSRKETPLRPMFEPNEASGMLIFGVIPRLPDKWWEQPENPRTGSTWNKQTWYLWGANTGNYLLLSPRDLLNGSGMASVEYGATRGHGHPQYIGIITTSIEVKRNTEVFTNVMKHLEQGGNVLVPTYGERWSLGSGAAVNRFPGREWLLSQIQLLSHIRDLAKKAKQVQYGQHTYWANCIAPKNPCANRELKLGDEGTFPLQSFEQLEALLAHIQQEYSAPAGV